MSLHAKASFFFILSLSHYELIQPWYSDKDRLQSSQCYAARMRAIPTRCASDASFVAAHDSLPFERLILMRMQMRKVLILM